MSFSEVNKNEILEWVKKAVIEKKNKNFKLFEEYGEKGFDLYPNKRDMEDDDIKTLFADLGYRYIKSMVKGYFENGKFESGKKWLDRLVEFNNIIHLFDEEVGFYLGQYFYETDNLEEAYKQWREVVRGSGKSHFRAFEGENTKYLEFYKAQKKIHDKK
jgi:tetratricopeptide (TPR) repeat protein